MEFITTDEEIESFDCIRMILSPKSIKVKRETISKRLFQNQSIRLIAQEVGRSTSSISQEIKRDQSRTGYWAFTANQKANANAGSKKKEMYIARPKASRPYGKTGMVTKRKEPE